MVLLLNFVNPRCSQFCPTMRINWQSATQENTQHKHWSYTRIPGIMCILVCKTWTCQMNVFSPLQITAFDMGMVSDEYVRTSKYGYSFYRVIGYLLEKLPVLPAKFSFHGKRVWICWNVAIYTCFKTLSFEMSATFPLPGRRQNFDTSWPCIMIMQFNTAPTPNNSLPHPVRFEKMKKIVSWTILSGLLGKLQHFPCPQEKIRWKAHTVAAKLILPI